MNEKYDVIIIGAGASGIMCAIEAGKRGRAVLIIDHSKKLGAKIKISGGGRCNFTNKNLSSENYISNNPKFCISALKHFTPKDFINLVTQYNIKYYEKTLGQQFCNESSKQIINMLLTECEKAKVEIQTEVLIDEVVKIENSFKIITKNSTFACKSLVIATGGLSVPSIGATNFGYKIAEQFGVNVTKTYPALVPLILSDSLLKYTASLSGISFNAVVSCGKRKFQEALLFTHKGLSGPVILQISSYWKLGSKITVNFMPELDVFQYLLKEKADRPKQQIQTILSKIMPKKFAYYVVATVAFCEGYLAELSNKKIKKISEAINNWVVVPTRVDCFAKAEVTLGGVDTFEISSKSFESDKVSGLYFIGEVLDVTGHLGGYNLQWAWSSGHAAGQFV
ncbi:MAG: NAD(P)/FAD-dependent oxidoreductase [Alphaproteobacteria bacterium]|nr:NAD(P)/FAD-dependent oxidoreductase [Rickettsiales bacterium]